MTNNGLAKLIANRLESAAWADDYKYMQKAVPFLESELNQAEARGMEKCLKIAEDVKFVSDCNPVLMGRPSQSNKGWNKAATLIVDEIRKAVEEILKVEEGE